MAVHQDIRDWANTLPAWQQDALRRITNNEDLTGDDIKALVMLVKTEQGIPTPPGSVVEAQPLSIPKLVDVKSQDAVSLAAITNLKNINALADDQPVPFGRAGITVIFGDNGSGKTGFGRLLRTLCWARKRPGSILKNLGNKDESPQQAVVTYCVGDAEQAPFTWSVEATPPAELGRISVYDVDCGAVYIDEEQRSAYAPFGLDLFPKLAGVCDRVRDEVKAEYEVLQRAKATWPEDLNGTAVMAILERLPSPEAEQELDQLAPLSQTEEEKLRVLSEALDDLKRDNPQKKVAALRNEVQRLRNAKRRVDAVADALGDVTQQTLKDAVANASSKAMAARVASEKTFGGNVLSGTGGPVWEELWNSARKFSETVAYPGRAFPVHEDGDRCVLCQQGVEGEAATRLKTFDEFVKEDVAKQAQKASAEVDNTKRAIRKVECAWPDAENIRSELELRDAGVGTTLMEFLAAAQTRQTALLLTDDKTDWVSLPQMTSSPADRLEELAAAAEAQAQAIEAGSKASNKEDKAREVSELLAKKWLAANKPSVESEIKRMRLAAKLENIVDVTTHTAKITTAGNVLTEKHVTKALQKRLRDELDELRVAHLGVELSVKRGAKGTTLHQLLLTRSPGHPIRDVLSSGERNLVGLAAFFAELDPDRQDAIIFDDPVSSLDQDKREEVARRLVQEAQHRQVIAWTHDLSFLGALKDWRDKLKSPELKVLTIANLDGVAGIVEHKLPWLVMDVKERIKVLGRELDELRALSKAKDVGGFTDKGRLFYGRLRDTWERATEEVLFKDVVQRWRKSVQTQRLHEVADNVVREDFETINGAMMRCGTFVHDQTGQTPAPLPRTVEIEADLETLRRWVSEKRKTPSTSPTVKKASEDAA